MWRFQISFIVDWLVVHNYYGPMIVTAFAQRNRTVHQKGNKFAIRKYILSCCCLDSKSYLTLCDPMDCSLPGPLGVPRQDYWSKLPFLSLGNIPDSGVKPRFPAWQADSLPLSHRVGGAVGKHLTNM